MRYTLEYLLFKHKPIRMLVVVGLLFSATFHLMSSNKRIDRFALVSRNNVHVQSVDSLASLSVGNGNFAFTTDITGLQTFPEVYKNGIPLGTQSQWGWHSFPNTDNYKHSETLVAYNFRGREELYSVPLDGKGRQQNASEWYRVNSHRLHLGIVGLEISKNNGEDIRATDIQQPGQTLDLWRGEIKSHFSIENQAVTVKTVCDPEEDMIASTITSPLISRKRLQIKFQFSYPSGGFADDACNWNANDKHQTLIIEKQKQSVTLKRIIDATEYYVTITWSGQASFKQKEQNYFTLKPDGKSISFTVRYTQKEKAAQKLQFNEIEDRSVSYWKDYWTHGGAVDLSQCTDPRAKELERRIVLSQYLTAIQCAGDVPPQETGLTYNSWYGKFHLEMHWWHAVHFSLWGRSHLMEKSLDWYKTVAPVGKEIAERQGFSGIRWMKMTDPSGTEAPSTIGSFLIWQQPHFIYMANLAYRNNPTKATLDHYKDLVFATAEFMASFATYDSTNNRYILKNIIPAQETLPPDVTFNPPFELAYWYWALTTAVQWEKLARLPINNHWLEVKDQLSKLAQKDGLYLAAESAPDTYQNVRYTSDHMAVLGAYGILPECNLFTTDVMKNTFDWIWKNWNWNQTWGWDYPMTAMCATRLGLPEKAIDALLMDKKTNTYLINGHNYQDDRLRLYLPGNGGLLTAIAMMCAGWDGCNEKNPGFPKNGKWNIQWEGLQPMP